MLGDSSESARATCSAHLRQGLTRRVGWLFFRSPSLSPLILSLTLSVRVSETPSFQGPSLPFPLVPGDTSLREAARLGQRMPRAPRAGSWNNHHGELSSELSWPEPCERSLARP